MRDSLASPLQGALLELSGAIDRAMSRGIFRADLHKVVAGLAAVIDQGNLQEIKTAYTLLVHSAAPKMSDLGTMTEIHAALKQGPLKLPGGGSIGHTYDEDGKLSKITMFGPFSINELVTFSSRGRDFFNLESLSKGPFDCDRTYGIALRRVEGDTLGLTQFEALTKGDLPNAINDVLVMFAAQTIPEFHQEYIEQGKITLRTDSGDYITSSMERGLYLSESSERREDRVLALYLDSHTYPTIA